MASTIAVQNIEGPTTGANANKVIIPSGHTLDVSSGTLIPSSGQVVQVKTTTFSNVISTTSTSFVSLAGGGNSLSVTITPTNASNRLLIMVMLAAETYNASYTDRGIDYAIYQDGVEIYRADYDLYNSSDAGQRIQRTTPMVEIAAGKTTASTINMNYRSTVSGGNTRINNYGGPSVMTVMEIAQ